eukprot:TRINITY_DN4894_c0_g1_i3.p1 TRINITY_DN4894_c0_g1~~TRINITY_DN4894_c0_g1_i3.p1  ORF type:complete len:193 (+),score=35.94 TRINITY_DN4894_c0_g1_i3:48-626(+)
MKQALLRLWRLDRWALWAMIDRWAVQSRYRRFFERNKDFIEDAFFSGVYAFNIGLKATIIVQVFKYLFDWCNFTWEWGPWNILGGNPRHPITPPFVTPHPSDKENYAKWQKLTDGVGDMLFYDANKYLYLYAEHPKMETSHLVDEFLFEADSKRIIDELKHDANLRLARKGVINSNRYVFCLLYTSPSPRDS